MGIQNNQLKNIWKYVKSGRTSKHIWENHGGYLGNQSHDTTCFPSRHVHVAWFGSQSNQGPNFSHVVASVGVALPWPMRQAAEVNECTELAVSIAGVAKRPPNESINLFKHLLRSSVHHLAFKSLSQGLPSLSPSKPAKSPY